MPIPMLDTAHSFLRAEREVRVPRHVLEVEAVVLEPQVPSELRLIFLARGDQEAQVKQELMVMALREAVVLEADRQLEQVETA